jgi:DNA (cytosine-5)-methyltransferase 1
MNELALFAGAGGGILGGHLLGWRTVCAVEWEQYPASVLCARQNDGLLPPFPIWDDVCTFDGNPWRGIVQVISGGFPCQDISAAGGGLALTENEAECGEKWRGSFVKYDPNLSLWKTHQCSLLGDLDEFLETWPQWGLMRDGECWEQRTLAQTIRGTESGLSPNNETFFHTPCTTGLDGGSNSRKALKKRLQNWPTPLSTEYRANRVKRENHHNGLTQAVLATQDGGQLNPTWVEWLMGWPLEWTDLKQLEMDKSPSVQQPHGES